MINFPKIFFRWRTFQKTPRHVYRLLVCGIRGGGQSHISDTKVNPLSQI